MKIILASLRWRIRLWDLPSEDEIIHRENDEFIQYVHWGLAKEKMKKIWTSPPL